MYKVIAAIVIGTLGAAAALTGIMLCRSRKNNI